jgi:hypothetical protein
MTRKRIAQPEHFEQCVVVEFFELQYPKFALCLIASMNGASLGGNALQRAIQIRKHKLAGMKTGASDLFLAVPRGTYHGLWIEMKATGKTASSLSDDQAEHLTLMREQGYHAVWCAGSDAAIAVIKDYMQLKQ